MSAPAGKASDAVAQRVNDALRHGILAAARSRRLDAVARKHGMRLGAQRFVAGETFAECAEVLARLNAGGLYANTTLLGEDVLSADEARAVVSQYEAILDGIAERELRVNVALKLTHLGLLLDEELAYQNVRHLVDHAASLGNFIRIDMEHSGLVDQTLGIYRRLRADGPRLRGDGAAGLPLPHARRPERAAAAATQPAPRQGRVPRAARDRLSAQGRRRRRLRATDRGDARGRRATPRSRRTTSR